MVGKDGPMEPENEIRICTCEVKCQITIIIVVFSAYIFPKIVFVFDEAGSKRRLDSELGKIDKQTSKATKSSH